MSRGLGPGREKGQRVVLRNEFASVAVRLDTNANGPRLEIEALRSGARIWLDPLEVESLTQWRHRDLAAFVLSRQYSFEVDEKPPGP